MCRYCDSMKRRDMYHCYSCGTCNEYHDHHCGVVNICICAANYKYFILFMLYGALMWLALLISLIVLSNSYDNKLLAGEYN